MVILGRVTRALLCHRNVRIYSTIISVLALSRRPKTMAHGSTVTPLKAGPAAELERIRANQTEATPGAQQNKQPPPCHAWQLRSPHLCIPREISNTYAYDLAGSAALQT